jgi:hypothetical protein
MSFRFASLRSPAARAVLLLALLPVLGCTSIGPGTVQRDRMHYSSAVADSWKEQLLLNIVRSRFGDAPAFLEVSSVVSGYSLETGVTLGGQFSPQSLRGDTFTEAGVAAKLTDRPTISYTPMTGDRYARSLISPVPLDTLMFVLQGGAAADFILGLTVQSIEGHNNFRLFAGQYYRADPEFLRLLELLRTMQQGNEIESEIENEQGQTHIWLRFNRSGSMPAGSSDAAKEVQGLMGFPPNLTRGRVVFGTKHEDPEVVSFRTRSLMQILSVLGAGVRIPPDHPAYARAVPVDTSQAPPGFVVQSGPEKPKTAFAAVPYEGSWFWIESEDLRSKTTLSAVTLLFNFLEGSTKSSPVLTIPTN